MLCFRLGGLILHGLLGCQNASCFYLCTHIVIILKTEKSDGGSLGALVQSRCYIQSWASHDHSRDAANLSETSLLHLPIPLPVCYSNKKDEVEIDKSDPSTEH